MMPTIDHREMPTTVPDEKVREWEASYRRRENFLFHPNEEVIRFFARHVRKRVGADDVAVVPSAASMVRVLDVGCGIGRHVLFVHRLGLEAFGFDHAEEALRTARRWLTTEGHSAAADRLARADVRKLPWRDGAFDVAVSHAVLDSMPLEMARAGAGEVARLLRPAGLFYLDLIAGGPGGGDPSNDDEVVVAGAHELGTVQSYFSRSKIEALLGAAFAIAELVLVERADALTGTSTMRWHVVARRV